MNRVRLATMAMCVIVLAAGVVLGHHAAQGMAPEEIWLMVDELLDGTPHSDMVVTDFGTGWMELTFTTPTVRGIQEMIGGGLFEYLGMLGCELTVEIETEGWTRPVMYVRIDGMEE